MRAQRFERRLKILLYARAFPPSVGGLETMTANLAAHIVAAGHQLVVITETPASPAAEKSAPAGVAGTDRYLVVRQPSQAERLRRVGESDLVHSSGASLALFFHAKLLRKPFLWTHHGYQMVSVDGLGWADDRPAPIGLGPSLSHHFHRRGVAYAAKEGAKLLLRRYVGTLVDRNVAVSTWLSQRQPLPNQVVIYNPFPFERFRAARGDHPVRFDFMFLGRLVSEKGADTLLRAFAGMVSDPALSDRTLVIIGDGPQRAALETLATGLRIPDRVTFVGAKHGDELLELIRSSAVAVVPTAVEETMGAVGLELLAAGKPLIIAERGGLKECVGDAAIAFPNGDVDALADCLRRMASDPELRRELASRADQVLSRFDETTLARRYLDLYADVVGERRR